mmetsp:Transcript_18871/g.27652  ORF Transcript_18871/g.27652 Transcript_18871/m.27652 type:complete len:561 (-) Transcript_18871:94-1776(-)
MVGVRDGITGFLSTFRSQSYDDETYADTAADTYNSRSLHSARSESTYHRSKKRNEYGQSLDMCQVPNCPAGTDSSFSESDDAESPPTSPQSKGMDVVDSILRTMFGSCTGVAQNLARTLDGAETEEQEYNDQQNRRRTRSHGHVQTKSTRARSVGRSVGSSGRSKKPQQSPQARIPKVENDECYYARFYADDHAQAAQAVLQLREREEVTRAALLATNGMNPDDPKIRSMVKLKELGVMHQNRPHEITRNFPQQALDELVPIDTSAPPSQSTNNDDEGGRLNAIALLAPAASADEADENTYIDFDDGISALSAHTLEEMTRRDTMMAEAERCAADSGDKFQTAVAAGWRRHKARQAEEAANIDNDDEDIFAHPPKQQEKTKATRQQKKIPKNDNAKHYNTPVSTPQNSVRHYNTPVKLDRNNSRFSAGDCSHNTGISTNFESVWKKDEAQYWQDVAEGEKEDGERNKRQQRKTKQKGQEGDVEQKKIFSSHNYHPHDTIQPLFASSNKNNKNKTRKSKSNAGGFSHQDMRSYQNYDLDANGFPTSNASPFDEVFGDVEEI